MSTLREALRAAASPIETLPDATGWQRHYTFGADSAVFAGHFPGYAVLPGVVQILMAQMTLEEALGRPLRLSAIPQAKFTAPLEPGTVMTLHVQQGRRMDVWDCTLRCAGRIASRVHIDTGSQPE